MDKPDNTPPKIGYLPSLDGWRAVAIIGVMVTHDLPWLVFGHSTTNYKGLGGHGVELFFAISGFLITTRILEEEKLGGHFNIKRFYIRRIFRIQPPALVYLATIGALIGLGVLHDLWSHWFGALFLYENFQYSKSLSDRAFFFEGHFWTLAVEEHFYILLSLTLFFFKRNRILLLALLYFGFVFGTALASSHGYGPSEFSYRRTYWQIHFLLLPSLVAALLRRKDVTLAASFLVQPWAVLLGAALLIPINRLESQYRHGLPLVPFHPRVDTINFERDLSFIVTYLFVLWIVATVLHPQSWTTRLLETAPLRFVGRISYSLYIWHVLFFSRLAPSTGVTNPLLVVLSGRPAKYIAAFAVASLSYYLIEKPMIRIGHKLAPPATAGRPELSDLPVDALYR